MDLETTQTNAAAKLPLLKQGEYEMWRLRIEQYFQIQDYALWEIIENGNSFKPVPQTTQNTDDTSTLIIPGAVTTIEKARKKNDVKARISTASSSISTDSTQDSTAKLSEAIVYAFLANQPNRSQLVHEDIHKDDLEEMDLKWHLALLSMEQGDISKEMGRRSLSMEVILSPRNQESRPRYQDNRNKNQDSSRRTVNVKETSSKAMVAIDGAGFD
ncbi:hypothetical protein Tco_0227646 [Tanacetum coccineum]